MSWNRNPVQAATIGNLDGECQRQIEKDRGRDAPPRPSRRGRPDSHAEAGGDEAHNPQSASFRQLDFHFLFTYRSLIRADKATLQRSSGLTVKRALMSHTRGR
jgi:hypothetical protein